VDGEAIMVRWCRFALTALVATVFWQGQARATDEARADLDARLEALREQRESRLVHSPATLSRRPTGAQATPAAGDFIVNNDGFIGSSNQSQIQVGRQPDGGSVVVWTDDRDGNPSVYGQVFDSLGIPVAANFRLHADPGNLVQQDPDLLIRSDGGFYACFTQIDADGDQDVIIMRFSRLGQRLGAGVSAAPDSSASTTEIQRRGRLLILADGAVMVVFERDRRNDPNSDIRAQLLTVNAAARQGLPLDVSADLVVGGTTIEYDEREPELARGQNDTVWVAWTDNRDGGVRDVFVHRLRRPTTNTLALVGSPIKVNDEAVAANASQKTPVIAVSPNGNAHVAWADFRNQHWDVFKSSFTPAGARLGANSRANFSENTSLDQTEPSFTWQDTTGLVVWKDFRLGVARIFAQKYRNDGSAVNANYAVGAAVSANQFSPSVSLLPSRSYSVAWAQPEAGFTRAYVRHFDSADVGSAAVSAAEIVISAQQVRPSTGISAGGELFTVWEEARAALPNIVGQALNSALSKPQPDVQVNDGPAVLHLVPAVGVGGSTGFSVWEDYRDTLQPVYSDIYIRQFTLTATGYTASGSNVRVIDTVESQEVRLASWNPDVAVDAAGNALVVWQDNRLGSWDIFSARYSATTQSGTGNPQRVGLNLRLDQAPDFTKQTLPRVDVNDAGRSVVVWEDTRDGSYEFQVWARILNGAGASLVGGEIELSIDTALVPRQPDVAVASSGEFAVVYEEYSNPSDVDVYLQRFDLAGARLPGALGDPVLLNDDGAGAHQFNVRVAAINGGYVAAWQDDRSGDWDVYATLVVNGLTTANVNYRVNDADISDQTAPTIAARRSENNPFIGWEDLRVATTAPDIFGNRNPATVASGASDDEPDIRPLATTLAQNFPNPFNPATQISFVLDRPGPVSLVVFNTLGQKVRTILSGEYGPGAHTAQWNGADEGGHAVASGTYFYRLTWDAGEVTRKMTLLR